MNRREFVGVVAAGIVATVTQAQAISFTGEKPRVIHRLDRGQGGCVRKQRARMKDLQVGDLFVMEGSVETYLATDHPYFSEDLGKWCICVIAYPPGDVLSEENLRRPNRQPVALTTWFTGTFTKTQVKDDSAD